MKLDRKDILCVYLLSLTYFATILKTYATGTYQVKTVV